MFRFLVTMLLAICIAGGVGYGMGWFDPWLVDNPDGSRADGREHASNKVELGGLLYAATALPQHDKHQAPAWELLPIDPCHVVVYETQEISFQKDGGSLLFVGEALFKDPETVNPSRPVLTIPVSDGVNENYYRYLSLKENDPIHPEQIVALVNPEFALREHESKKLKVDAAKADHFGTEAILKEVQRRLVTLRRLASGSGGSKVVSELEIGEAEVSVAKYQAEQITKKLAIGIAEAELASAKIFYDTHFLKSKLTGKGIVKIIYKKQGEGIKAQEPVMQLWNISSLRLKGSVDSQYGNTLLENLGAKCYLEPSVELDPQMQLIQAHRGEVTCVGVCSDGEHFVSGGDDRNVFVWKRGHRKPLPLQLRHSAAVRTIACSPKGMWILVGCADGSIWRWDLSDPSPSPVKFKDQHRGPVTALAFSPEVKSEDGTVEAEAGKWFASGGEDNTICLWNTAEGEVLAPYQFVDEHGEDGHQGTITSLHFTPQCTLVSAARDNTLRVWQLHQKGAKLIGDPISNRGGTVSNLGVSADGRYMLFDKGKTLQFLNPADGSPAGCELVNMAGSNPFDMLAIFSPDGSLMMTGGAGDGRLSLWKTPTPSERGFQVRELVSQDKAPITSAAFGPKGFPFAVTGSKEGYVHLWALPDEEAVMNHRIFFDGLKQHLQLNLVDFEVAAGKTSITVNVNNPTDRFGRLRLKPGQRATLVVMLPAQR